MKMETVMINNEPEMPDFERSVQLPTTQIEVLLLVASVGKGKSTNCEKLHTGQHTVKVGSSYVSLCPKCIKELRDNTSKYSTRLMLDAIPIMEMR
jgi:hypothetical protein